MNVKAYILGKMSSFEGNLHECKSLFSGKNKTNMINFLYADFVHRVGIVKALSKIVEDNILAFFIIFQRK